MGSRMACSMWPSEMPMLGGFRAGRLAELCADALVGALMVLFQLYDWFGLAAYGLPPRTDPGIWRPHDATPLLGP